MAPPDTDASVGHSFGLEVDGFFSSSLSGVAGLKMERDVVEVRELGPDGVAVVRKLPGRWKSAEVTLTRGLTADTGFESWVKDPQPGNAVGRRSGVVTVFDGTGAPVKRYRFTDAWPMSLEVVAVAGATGTPVVSERLVVVCDRLEPA
jgi:phage tail-like protein